MKYAVLITTEHYPQGTAIISKAYINIRSNSVKETDSMPSIARYGHWFSMKSKWVISWRTTALWLEVRFCKDDLGLTLPADAFLSTA